MVDRLLSGHISPETAYVVDDYHYGFRLRCKIRYWLEFNPRRGFRFLSQTTNPKVAGEVWNKPKASTYAPFGAAMYLDEHVHVAWTGLSEYGTLRECLDWRDKFGSAVPPEGQQCLDGWIAKKLAYDKAKAKGLIEMKTVVTHPDGHQTIEVEKLKPEMAMA